MFKDIIRFAINLTGFDIRRRSTNLDFAHDEQPKPFGIPDEALYEPVFSPWKGYGDFADYYALAQPSSLVSADRCYILLTLARQAAHMAGNWIECGVYRGGTASMLTKLIRDEDLNCILHLFDTFEGMPETDPQLDLHKAGDFAGTSLEEVKTRVFSLFGKTDNRIQFHPGFIPETFTEFHSDRITFAHIDVDIYKSVSDCCEFIYPRLVPGGFLIFDDYGFPTCPGARKAVDQFFNEKPEFPVVLPTGQALVVKAP